MLFTFIGVVVYTIILFVNPSLLKIHNNGRFYIKLKFKYIQLKIVITPNRRPNGLKNGFKLLVENVRSCSVEIMGSCHKRRSVPDSD